MLNYIIEIECNKSSGGDIPANIIKMAKDELTVPIINFIKISVFHQALFQLNLKFLTLSQSTKSKTWLMKLSTNEFITNYFKNILKGLLFAARNVKNIFTKTVWIQKRIFFKKPSFKLSKELAKMFRYIWSSRDGINGPQ